MKHPSEATLALYAGGDLGLLSRWRTQRHLAGCEQCRGEIEALAGVRKEVAGLDELPEVSWNRLAAEMKANIRLGLAAGECVGGVEQPAAVLGGLRAIAAYAAVALLLAAGVLLERPTPRVEGVSVRATAEGIEVRDGEQAFGLLHGSARNAEEKVIYSVGAQGAMRARYVDSKTGYVTINTVYVQ